MSCPACGAPVVAFAVPPELREHAPADDAAICSRCLEIVAASDAGVDDVPTPEDAEFTIIHESFPGGRGGVAFALALGKLDSLALNRAAIEALCEAAERAGTDVPLALERLAGAEELEPPFDIGRRSQQLASFR
ncbi:hypothetical protein B4589_010515 [Halolamina sp. CBA1230]|uniref:DUF6276 family protein n=1 Tax=Halolamina sp. CBA1230 TaxID=1853690 RepID=UPI0009A190E6|nr:DUF6276 family protein [Halolamina sp. CBA1230]QKY20789.1 hypothetical protein B4589_010515 [Halolamina sp. CBA1230]